MALSLMYITNNPQVAAIAQASGVDRIFVDMEYIGKDIRQAGMNTVKSHHTYEDIKTISAVTQSGKSQLLVRVNPIHEAAKAYCSSKEEIETAISCGADVIMLPMFKTCREVESFLNIASGKVKTMLLLETKEAAESIDELISLGGFDELHIGLNDLHLAYGKKFMFELLSDGTVDRLAEKLNSKAIRFGFGGIARIGYGTLPAEYIIAEHYRLNSQAAILSRSFCNADKVEDMQVLRRLFSEGVRNIRNFEKKASAYTNEEYAANHETVISLVGKIAGELNGKG